MYLGQVEMFWKGKILDHRFDRRDENEAEIVEFTYSWAHRQTKGPNSLLGG